jgi:hypothetical protein
MARARFIRPEFFTDTKLADMPMGASMLFAGIWCHSDLNGVFEYDARVLRSLIFGVRDEVSTAMVQQWLDVLLAAGILLAYRQADGKVWGVVKNWTRYQSISGSERKWGARRPNPLDHNTASTMTALGMAQCHAQACPLSPTPTPTPTPSNMPDKSGECLSGESAKNPRPSDEPVEPAMFEVFWNDYAKKRDRAAVVRYWNRMSPEDRHLAYDGVLRYVAANPDPQYRKDPIRYLKNKSWEDEAITHEPGKAQTVEQAAKECPHAPGSYEAMDWWVMNYPWFIPGCDVPNPNKASA